MLEKLWVYFICFVMVCIGLSFGGWVSLVGLFGALGLAAMIYFDFTGFDQKMIVKRMQEIRGTLVSCTCCGKDISSNSSACPHCGQPRIS